MNDKQGVASFFKAIAHPTRINILKTIYGHSFCVNDISGKLKLNQPNTSQHLAILSKKNILVKTKKGTEVCYRIKDPTVMKIIDAAEKFSKKLSKKAPGRKPRG